MKWIAALIFAIAAPVLAEERAMTGAEFQAFSEGYTLHFEDEAGEYFGSEQYLPDRQTIWHPRGGQCEPGVWASAEGRICFLYAVGIACWRVYRDEEDSLLAISADDGAEGRTRLRLKRKDKSPVLCPDGPAV